MSLMAKHSVGVEIDDGEVVVVELENGSSLSVKSMGKVMLDKEVVVNGRIINPGALLRSVQLAASGARPTAISLEQVVTGLPESQVFSRVVSLGAHEAAERDGLVMQEAQTSFPIEAENLLLSYSVVKEIEGGVELLMVGIHREVWTEWKKFWEQIGAGVTFDLEALALFRGLFENRVEKPIAIVDIGSMSTSVTIFNQWGLRYSYLIEMGSAAVIGRLAERGMSDEEIQEWIVKVGMANKKDENFELVAKELEPVLEGVEASLEYYRDTWGEEVHRVLVVGHFSRLKGLVEFIKDSLGVAIWLGEAWLIKNTSSVEYVEALGLGLRGFDREQDRIDPVMSFEELEEGETGHTNLSSEKEAMVTPIELQQIKKLRFERWLLVALLIFGTLGVGLFYWYRERTKSVVQSKPVATTEPTVVPTVTEPTPTPEEMDVELETAKEASGEADVVSDEADLAGDVILARVLRTPVGYLNARSGPGTEFDQVRRLQEGEEYELLEEGDEGWWKLKLDDELEGWVFADYVEKVE